MTTFANAVRNQEARTANGMKARKSTASALTDLFFKVGALRGKNAIPDFAAAFAADRELAIRIALWARDAREGSGERKTFRDILNWVATQDRELAIRMLKRVPDLGRFDDVLAVDDEIVRQAGYQILKDAINAKNGLAAKWMPRKGIEAVKLRNFLGMTPKQYRKTLVNLTKVVEQDMCANRWDEINFNHVPSVASARYKKAFSRHTAKYGEWAQKLAKGDTSVKVNAGAVYPYDVLKGLVGYYGRTHYDTNQLAHIKAQWDALPNFVGDANILPLVDVSGSMTCPAGGHASKSKVTCLDVAVSLGLYLADKNKGKFKDTFLTFSTSPELLHLKGNILEKIAQMVGSTWGMSTNLHAAMEKILQVAVQAGVPQEEMPNTLLILSDMQFNACTHFNDSAIEMIARKYEAHGYRMPNVVFWNLNAHDNVPVKFDKSGTALVSGFSPAIVKNVLAADLEQFTPEAIMKKTIMSDRYNF